MQLFNRYLLRLFVKVLLVCFVSITGLFIIIDAFGNLEEFISYGETQEGGLVRVLVEYYGARVLTFFDRTSALLSMVAAMFVVTWLQKTNEFTALMAAGVPRARILRPIIVAVLFVSLAAVVNRELLIPMFRDKLVRNAQNWTGDRTDNPEPQFDMQSEMMIGGRALLSSTQQIESPNFRMFRPLGDWGRQLAAQSAEYRPPRGDRPGGYLLMMVEVPADLMNYGNAYLNDEPVIFGPRDTPWLEGNQVFVASHLDFQQLANGSSWRRYASTLELIRGLRNPSTNYGADARVMVHARIVQPILDMTLLFLGLPLVVTRQSRSVFVAGGLCLLTVIGYFLLILISHALGANSLLRSAALAAWSPVLVLVPIAAVMARRISQ